VHPVNVQDAHGNTPLHLAAKTGRVAIVETLLKIPEADCTITDDEGRDALQVSKKEQCSQLLEGNYRSNPLDCNIYLLSEPS
jgi:ankyrin repeat protein